MKVLYLGSDPSRFKSQTQKEVIHFPLLEIVPRSLDSPQIAHVLDDIPLYTHCIFTSKHAVRLFVEIIHKREFPLADLLSKQIIAIGSSTAAALRSEGILVSVVAEEERQEGVIAKLRLIHWDDRAYVLMPRSSMARSALEYFFSMRMIRYQACDLYDTRPRKIDHPPSLEEVEEIIFTSPSTVHAFALLFPEPPQQRQLTAIGPVTTEALRHYIHKTSCKIDRT